MQHQSFTVQLGEEETYLNITKRVAEVIQGWDMDEGHILIFVEHTTCAIIVQEDEPRLVGHDLPRRLNVVAARSRRGTPKENDGYYEHDDFSVRTVNLESVTEERINGHSHIRASFLGGPSLTLMVQDGQLHLGRWQQVLFFDFDDIADPRERTISVSVIGG